VTTTDLRAFVRDVMDFPKPGIRFRDLTPLMSDPRALAAAVAGLAEGLARPDAVVAVESRGFIFGAPLALHWSTAFVPARKFGKLPGRTVRATYALEYGEDALELHADAVRPGQRVVIVDDLLATGGTAHATAQLVEQLGASVIALRFVVELRGLGGRERLAGRDVGALMELDA
jgi:adenine phosphoribosyltransferase